MIITAARIAAITVAALAASALSSAAWSHTRPLTPGAASLLAEAASRSAIIRDQLEALERTDLVVYVSDDYRATGDAPEACLRWVSRAGGRRYLQVLVAPWSTLPVERIAWLGHEFQHALEIAAAPDVRDEAGMSRLYRRIGWEGAQGHFESDAARRVGDLVRNELAGFPVDLEHGPRTPRTAGSDSLARPADRPTAPRLNLARWAGRF